MSCSTSQAQQNIKMLQGRKGLNDRNKVFLAQFNLKVVAFAQKHDHLLFKKCFFAHLDVDYDMKSDVKL